MKRRDFLRSSAVGLAAAGTLPSLLSAQTAKPLGAPAIVTTPKTIPRGAILDWHTHWIGPNVVKLLAARTVGPRFVINEKGERFQLGKGETDPRPGQKPQVSIWYDTDQRLAHLNSVGVERQVIGYVGFAYDGVLPPEEAAPFWRAQNDDIAALVRAHPKRFLGLATLPTADIPAAAAELERAHRDLGLIGATLPLDAFIHLESARALAPIFAVAQKYKSHLYIHRGAAAPTIPKQTPEVGETNAYFGLPPTRQPNGETPNLPGDHAWARSTLITSTHLAAGAITLALTDFLDPYPDVTVQLTMIGGSIAHLVEAVEQRTERDGLASPLPKLRRIYLDTGATGRGPRGIALAAKTFGADRILFGSDFGPWPTIEPFIKGVADAELSQEDRDLIYVENGRALLKAKGITI
ncbi:MAG: amidohydrolase family protein [Verrucomicrobia bacterium]|nr:amidohydrolase family protein [Verrucomicrobiota bacterium]